MAKRNDYDGHCDVCNARVRANEGMVVYEPDSLGQQGRAYQILCVEHSPKGSFDVPMPPEASKLPSIHRGEDRYER
jgi:hypothetical protein